MNTEDAILAVKRGAHLMDEKYPNWAHKINFDTFAMDSCHQCVVGQAIGDYGTAIARESGYEAYCQKANEWAVEYGFDVPMEDFSESDHAADVAYSELEELWTDQVRERLG